MELDAIKRFSFMIIVQINLNKKKVEHFDFSICNWKLIFYIMLL